MELLTAASRNLFFTGKGGVGKTSMACASAIALADRGRRVLLVSTDPASNLDEVLGTVLSSEPRAIAACTNLWALNIDPEQAAADYREKMIAPYRGVLPDAALSSMQEQFSGSCTMEIAAFDEFAKLLGDAAMTEEFDYVIFDTAPTGHTLRLLSLPLAWSGFIQENSSGASCLGPLSGLQEQQAVYQEATAALADAARTTLVLVSRPEPSSIAEANRTSLELRELGVSNQHLILNGVFVAHDPNDALALAMQERSLQAVENLPPALASLNRDSIPLVATNLIGVTALRRVFTETQPAPVAALNPSSTQVVHEAHPGHIKQLVDQLAGQSHGVILCMGKGGVGKTSVASAVAVALAQRGLAVHLSTTDPAAHLQTALAQEELPGLRVSRIDPQEVTAQYQEEVLQGAGAALDEQGRALLEEDLRSPCTEEIAVFRAFAAAVAEGEDAFVVLDTAPTGHTILLLDAALAYHREVSRQSMQVPEFVEKLLERLRDPEFTRVLIVTLPESTPVHEAARLQADLQRAEIEPYAWVLNQCLTPLSVQDPLLCARQAEEVTYINEVIDTHAQRAVLIPALAHLPVGVQGLRTLFEADEYEQPASRETGNETANERPMV